MRTKLPIDHRSLTGRLTFPGPYQRTRADPTLPRFVDHPSFHAPDAEWQYSDDRALPDDAAFRDSHMPDEVTRELAGRMHYAALRWHAAETAREARRWRSRYYTMRNRIVLGNRKLIFRAVRWRSQDQRDLDDLIGECDIVMIKVVGAYNPWLGIRFSTYAFKCLLRALARLRARLARPIEPLPQVAARPSAETPQDADRWPPLLRHFRKEDPLLSKREKLILERRYQLGGRAKRSTLEEVGEKLGLSKERVRQLQFLAVGKLRRALVEGVR